MVRKRGQAAIEFISTYTWALVLVFFLFSSLIYFGVIDLSSIVPERCDFGVQLQCLDYQFTPNSFGLALRNNFDVPIRINSLHIEANGKEIYLRNPDVVGGSLDRIDVGSSFNISSETIKSGELVYSLPPGNLIGFPTQYEDLKLIKGKRYDFYISVEITNADKCDFKSGCTGNSYNITGIVSTKVG